MTRGLFATHGRPRFPYVRRNGGVVHAAEHVIVRWRTTPDLAHLSRVSVTTPCHRQWSVDDTALSGLDDEGLRSLAEAGERPAFCRRCFGMASRVFLVVEVAA